jgi:hypothetical protein
MSLKEQASRQEEKDFVNVMSYIYNRLNCQILGEKALVAAEEGRRYLQLMIIPEHKRTWWGKTLWKNLDHHRIAESLNQRFEFLEFSTERHFTGVSDKYRTFLVAEVKKVFIVNGLIPIGPHILKTQNSPIQTDKTRRKQRKHQRK